MIAARTDLLRPRGAQVRATDIEASGFGLRSLSFTGLAAVATAILAIVAIWETASLRRSR